MDIYGTEYSKCYKLTQFGAFVTSRTTHNLVVKKNTVCNIINEIYNHIVQFKNNHLAIDSLLVKNTTLKSYDYFPHIFYSPSNYTTDIQHSKVKIIL